MVNCPAGYEPNYYTSPAYRYCFRNAFVQPPACRKGACPTPNPIDPLNGAKLRTEVDYQSASGLLSLVRHYHGYGHARRDLSRFPLMGDYWWFNYERRLFINDTATPPFAYLDRHDGSTTIFKQEGAQWMPMFDVTEKLSYTAATTSNPGFWTYKTRNNDLETYDNTGRLLKITRLDGTYAEIKYNSKQNISEIVDSFGRKITLKYNDDLTALQGFFNPAGSYSAYLLSPVAGPSGKTISEVTYADGKRKRYTYGQGSSGATATSLTGIYDENNNRYATFEYSMFGNAVNSELAGGVEKYLIWPNSVLRPTGERLYYTTENIAGMLRVTEERDAYNPSRKKTFAYDAAGNLTSKDDFTGKRTCYANDLARGLESARVEGLTNTVDCATVTPTSATLPANSRKISTQWHPDWRLESRVAEPGKITTYVYNGQSDPTAGGAVVSCAPGFSPAA